MYIHKTNCISAQQTFGKTDLQTLLPAVDNKMYAKEPSYEGVPPGMLRRMGRAVRMGVGCALPLLKDQQPDAIIVGTANGGMEDCIKFLNQIMDYDEGMLTPGNFVQSTPNATAAQLGLMTANRQYNITHVHKGLAFENAVLDAIMLLLEHPEFTILLQGLDEISTYNYNIDFLGGWFKENIISNEELFTIDSTGTLAGEGAAAFLVNNSAEGALAYVKAVHFLHTESASVVQEGLTSFLQDNDASVDILISGENGDNRHHVFFETVESILPHAGVVRFKHMFGEFGTSSAQALWLVCQQLHFPEHSIKKNISGKQKRFLVYNTYKGRQHSFILVDAL